MADLTGRLILITGATRGLGRATAEALAKMRAALILHGRDAAAVAATCRAITAATGNTKVTSAVADFSSLDAVRGLAREVIENHARLDVLVNNAGTGTLRRRTTADGYEWAFGINHLAPFLLTNLLRERLEASAPARIVTVSSAAHKRGMLELGDPQWEHRKYSGIQAYSDSKLANVLFTRVLAWQLQGTGVTANCLHPGVVATNIFSHMGIGGKILGLFGRLFMLPPAEGAKTSVYLASSPAVEGVTGKYFVQCREMQPGAAANDPDTARRLWELSEELTGLR
jgi:retinol dehydrogenase 12